MKRIVNYFLVRKTINLIRTIIIKRKYYISKNDNNLAENNTVVFCANGFLPHGGLADRIYGILTTYAVCKIKGLKFAIFFNSPYKLDSFLVPNEYDWYISEHNVMYNLKYSIPILRMGGCSVADFDSIKFNNNKQIHIYSNYKWLDEINKKYHTNFTWMNLFNELFQLNETFKSELFSIKNRLPKKYVSLQIRIQNALGDFKDCKSKELTKNEKKNLLNACEKKIREIYRNEKNPILLTSDSQIIIDYFKNKCKDILCFIPGVIIHTDNKDVSGYEEHKKTFIDLFCLASGEKIFQIVHKKIYRSGFSMLASQISGKNILWI